MPRRKKLSPIEIAKIRGSLPYLTRHGVTLPEHLLLAVQRRAKAPKIGRREVNRLVLALMKGPQTVSLSAAGFVIGKKRGPRAGGRRRGSSGRRPAKKTAKLKKARHLQGKYMGTLRGLNGAQAARVKKAKRDSGYTAAFALAKTLKG